MNSKDLISSKTFENQNYFAIKSKKSQGYKVILVVMIIFTIIFFFIIKNKTQNDYIGIGIFYGIFALALLFLKIIGFEKIAILPDKIIIEFPFKQVCLIKKEDIKEINFYVLSEENSSNLLYYFSFKLNKKLNVLLFYRNSFGFNSNVFDEEYDGERTRQLVEFLKTHYGDKIAS